MNDLVDEVEEALRHDRAAQFFKRNGKYIAGAVLVLILGIGGNSIYKNMERSRNEAATTQYFQTLKNADDKTALLAELSKLSGANIGLLAKFQYVADQVEKGHVNEAKAVLNSVISDSKLTPAEQDFSRVRLGLIELDTKNYDAALSAVAPVKSNDNPLRFVAYEIEALAQWAKGDAEAARKGFALIVSEPAAPMDFKQRASALMGMIDGGTKLTF